MIGGIQHKRKFNETGERTSTAAAATIPTATAAAANCKSSRKRNKSSSSSSSSLSSSSSSSKLVERFGSSVSQQQPHQQQQQQLQQQTHMANQSLICQQQSQNLQRAQAKQEESVWSIVGLMNNIEQFLSTINSINHNQPTAAPPTAAHHFAHSRASIGQLSTGSVTPVSSSSCSSSQASSPAQPTAAAAATTTTTTTTTCSSVIQAQHHQHHHQSHNQAGPLPRSPLSRQIKFHEYKGPPTSRRQQADAQAANRGQQQQQSSRGKPPSSSSESAGAKPEVAQQQQTNATQVTINEKNFKKEPSQSGKVSGQFVRLQPSQVLEFREQSQQLIVRQSAMPVQASSTQNLIARQAEQQHPQLQHQRQQQQQQRGQLVGLQPQHLNPQHFCLATPLALGGQTPAYCLADQSQLAQQQHPQQIPFDGSETTFILATPSSIIVSDKANNNMIYRQQQPFGQRQLAQAQARAPVRSIGPQEPTSFSFDTGHLASSVQAQQQQQLSSTDQFATPIEAPFAGGPESALAHDGQPAYASLPQPQAGSRSGPSESQPSNRLQLDASSELKNIDSRPTLRHHFDEAQAGLLVLDESSFQGESSCDDLDSCEPSINQSFCQGVDNELLFSEFIDLQNVPMNVDESDWLKKFLPPCHSMS